MGLRQTIVEKLAYVFFGNNLVVGRHIKQQLQFLHENIPDSFKHRKLDDLGCGDGKVTVYIKEIFQPAQMRCFDVNPGLVRRSCKRGFCADVMDLNNEFPSGELAVMWGSLHHMEDMGACLDRVRQNYQMAFIREPLNESGNTCFLELGHPVGQAEMARLIEEHLPGAQIIFDNNAAFIFYKKK